MTWAEHHGGEIMWWGNPVHPWWTERRGGGRERGEEGGGPHMTPLFSLPRIHTFSMQTHGGPFYIKTQRIIE